MSASRSIATSHKTLSWYQKSIEECLVHFQSSVIDGLAKETVEKRQANRLTHIPHGNEHRFIKQLVRQFSSPVVLILVLATIATLFLKEYTEAAVIVLALSVNIVMGIIQEGRASRAFETLKKNEATYAVVVREGEITRIKAEEVVLGDLIVLVSGSAVPADMRLVEAHGLTLDESMLSGEWFPVEKTTETLATNTPLIERTNMAYAGTVITGGTGKGIAVGVGSSTEIGQLAKQLGEERKTQTPLTKDIRDIAKVIAIVVIAIVIVISILGYLRGLPLADIIGTAIALAVASVPEGLPAAVTVVLALGMERILRAGGLVRSLLAAETLGTTSIILTDKTGTLTEGKMTIDSLVTWSGEYGNTAFEERAPRALIQAGVLASNAYIEERAEPAGENKLVAHGRPVDQALTMSGLQLGITKKSLESEHTTLDELPFDSAHRFGGTIVTHAGVRRAYFAGAPELFFAAATHVQDEHGKKHVFDTALKARFSNILIEAAKEGKRVIAIAQKDVHENVFPKELSQEFVEKCELLGLVIFSDPVRPEVKEAIHEIQGAGTRVIMLTGDNPETAASIAREAGITKAHECVHVGVDLDPLTDTELLDVLRHCHVFARVTPTQKLRIASVLTAVGEVVAMTGDGVNDAPALRAATIGVAVGSGTDVAKESSDLVLLRNGFTVIASAIKEGRRLRDNFKKIFAYMLSTNFSEVTLITVALAAGFPLPLLPTQILWSNLVEGGLMNFAFAFEPLHPSAMKRKPTDPDVRHVLSKNVLQLLAFVGTVTALLLVTVYFYLLSIDLPLPTIQTIMFIGTSINCIFIAFSIKSFGTPLWRISFFSNTFLLIALLASVILLCAALFVPFIQLFLGTVAIAPLWLLACVGFGVVNVITIEVAKWLFFVRSAPRTV